jgi:PIN domain nuclease of toxin-antitoxin system
MTILLDTHTFLWWIINDRQLSATAKLSCEIKGMTCS